MNTLLSLRPYVSHRVDPIIEKRELAYEKLVSDMDGESDCCVQVLKHGSEEKADAVATEEEKWPPPRMTAKTLFDLHYADSVKTAFRVGNG